MQHIITYLRQQSRETFSSLYVRNYRLYYIAQIISTVVSACFLFGSAVLAAAFMPSLRLTGLVMVLVGIFSINFSSLGNSLLQLESSPQMRGRVMSSWLIAFLGSTTLGAPIVGWFAEVIGGRWALALGGAAALVAAALAAFISRNDKE